MPNKLAVGQTVRIQKGYVGEGYRFTVKSINPGHFGETQVYGDNYGPVRASELEILGK